MSTEPEQPKALYLPPVDWKARHAALKAEREAQKIIPLSVGGDSATDGEGQ